MVCLYNDFNTKKPKKLPLLSHSPYNLQPNLSHNKYSYLQSNVYNNYSNVNKYIKNKL